MLRGVVDAALEHAAPMAVGRDLDAVGRNGIVDELRTPDGISRRLRRIRGSASIPGYPPVRACLSTSG